MATKDFNADVLPYFFSITFGRQIKGQEFYVETNWRIGEVDLSK
jgi:hypothetical protein